MKRLLRAGLALGLLALGASAQAAPQPFTADSYRQIVEQHAGKPLLLVLWSVDCPPCHQELSALGKVLREHPGLPVVLVATDEQLPPEEIQAVLDRHGLGAADHWQFADPVPARLRRAVDPGWYGELPRSYLIGVDGERHAHSGMLNEAALRELVPWLSGASRN